jgi:hypothetical protein
LATSVVDGSVIFGDTVSDTDYSSWFIRSAREWSLVATSRWIWVFRVDSRRIPDDAICCVDTVRAIESIKECVEATVRKGFNEVVNLVEGDGLRLLKVSIKTTKLRRIALT